jgi:hypothetical protein
MGRDYIDLYDFSSGSAGNRSKLLEEWSSSLQTSLSAQTIRSRND